MIMTAVDDDALPHGMSLSSDPLHPAMKVAICLLLAALVCATNGEIIFAVHKNQPFLNEQYESQHGSLFPSGSAVHALPEDLGGL